MMPKITCDECGGDGILECAECDGQGVGLEDEECEECEDCDGTGEVAAVEN